jgi:hypothetical protein
MAKVYLHYRIPWKSLEETATLFGSLDEANSALQKSYGTGTYKTLPNDSRKDYVAVIAGDDHRHLTMKTRDFIKNAGPPCFLKGDVDYQEIEESLNAFHKTSKRSLKSLFIGRYVEDMRVPYPGYVTSY